jgi:hypothetical protein
MQDPWGVPIHNVYLLLLEISFNYESTYTDIFHEIKIAIIQIKTDTNQIIVKIAL